MSSTPDDLNTYMPTHSAFKYTQWPFYWVARTDKLYTQRLEKALKRAGLTVTGWRVGMLLNAHHVLSVSEISIHSAVKLSTVTRTVYGMQDKGWLRVNPRASDARVTETRLTEQGRKQIEAVVSETSVVFDRALNGFSEDDLKLLNRLLHRCVLNLSEH